MRSPYSYKQFSLNNFLSTPKSNTSRTTSHHHKEASHSYSFDHFQPWAKPLNIKLQIKNPKQPQQKLQNLIKPRKFMSNLKYKKIIIDKIRKNSGKHQEQEDKSEDKYSKFMRCITPAKTRRNSNASVDSTNQMQSIKQTLHHACQTKPIKLSSRPVSSKIVRTEPCVTYSKTPKFEQLFKRVRKIVSKNEHTTEIFGDLTGW